MLTLLSLEMVITIIFSFLKVAMSPSTDGSIISGVFEAVGAIGSTMVTEDGSGMESHTPDIVSGHPSCRGELFTVLSGEGVGVDEDVSIEIIEVDEVSLKYSSVDAGVEVPP